MDDFEPLELATDFRVFGVFDSPSLPPWRDFAMVLLCAPEPCGVGDSKHVI
jgi:hypothetical protein